MKNKLQDFRKQFEAKVWGRFIFTKLVNGQGAPFIDKCVGQLNGEKNWKGYAIQINPFNFNKDGKRKEGKCFVVGVIHR
jgi:hypothetical protein